MSETPLLFAFYGDDFTGSTDAMEALSINGYRTLLFVEPPTEEMLKRFDNVRCIGIAGTSRAKDPEMMETEIAPIFDSLTKLNVPLIHYKTCSTFDSSPTIGSIGKAIDVSRDYFGKEQLITLLVGAPELGRYTVFGNHFAKMHGEIYRLDRHPTMSKHPSTPMDEADLGLHLGKQTDEEISLFNIIELEGKQADVIERFNKKYEDFNGVVLLDSLDNERMTTSGAIIYETAEKNNIQSFTVGSSGIEYALSAYWNERGLRDHTQEEKEVVLQPVDQILAVSGSGSPVTKLQIENALKDGFHGIQVRPENLVNNQSLPTELLTEAIQEMNNGKSVVIYTALGPDDESIPKTRKLLKENGIHETGEHIGTQLGKWIREILKEVNVSRVVVAGGDTSGFVTKEMDIFALEVVKPLSPGAPLCKGYSNNSQMNNIELALKGGQLGSVNYFTDVLRAQS